MFGLPYMYPPKPTDAMSTPKWMQDLPAYVKAIGAIATVVTVTAGLLAASVLGDVPKNTDAILINRDSISALRADVVDLQRATLKSDSASAARDRFLICLLTDAKDATGLEAEQICRGR